MELESIMGQVFLCFFRVSRSVEAKPKLPAINSLKGNPGPKGPGFSYVLVNYCFYALARERPKPPLCKGRWSKSMILTGGVVKPAIPQSKIKVFCQPPLHKGAESAVRIVR